MNPPTLIYDGDCGICERFCRVIERFNWLGRFEARPLQDEGVYADYPMLSRAACEREIKFIKAGRVFSGSDAIMAVFRQIPILAPIGVLFVIPPFSYVARWLYPVIADNRYRISATCGIDKRKV